MTNFVQFIAEVAIAVRLTVDEANLPVVAKGVTMTLRCRNIVVVVETGGSPLADVSQLP
jgi:hypothetical protein